MLNQNQTEGEESKEHLIDQTQPNGSRSKDHSDMKTELKIMTYNICHGEGEDKVLNLERIAKVIEDSNADIIGLQEVDNHWSERSHFEDQSKWLGERLNMFYSYGANLDYGSIIPKKPRHQYGNLILSRYPILESKNYLLPKIGNNEQRGVLETKIDVKGNHIMVYNTHLALTQEERISQVEEILKIMAKSQGPKIFLGDFNATPNSKEVQKVYVNYMDTLEGKDDEFTYPASKPVERIDYIFISKEIENQGTQTIPTLASDHLPIVSSLSVS